MLVPAAGLVRARPHLAVAATLVALAPVLVALARVVGHETVLYPDTSVIDLLVRDVLTGDSPLVGPYSRFGFNHPGPLYFYALTPLNVVFDGATWSTLAGAAVLHGIAIVWACRLAWRRGGLALVLLVAAALLGTYGATGTEILVDAWNPNPLVPLCVVFVLQVWSVLVGDHWRLVGAAGVGSFLVQTHTGYVPVVAVGIAAVVVGAVVDGRRDPSVRRQLRRPAAVAAAVAVALWIPVLVDQLWFSGNLGEVIEYSTGGRAEQAGLRRALGLLAAEFRVVPPWLGGDDLVGAERQALPAAIGWLALPALGVAAGLVVAHRRGRGDLARLLLLVTAIAGVGVAALSGYEPPLFGYLFAWRIVAATLLVAALGLLAVRALDLRVARAPGAVALVVGLLVVAAGGALVAEEVATRPRAEAALSATALELAEVLADDAPRGPVLLRDASSRLTGLYDGLVDLLEQEGLDVRVDEQLAFSYGRNRGASTDDVVSVWHVTDRGLTVSALSGRPGAEVLVLDSPLSEAEELELQDVQRRLLVLLDERGRAELVPRLDDADARFALSSVPGIDRDLLDRLLELNAEVRDRGGYRSAVIAFAPDDPLVTGEAGD